MDVVNRTTTDSYAIARLEVQIARDNLDRAVSDEEFASAARLWWSARQALRAAIVEEQT